MFSPISSRQTTAWPLRLDRQGARPHMVSNLNREKVRRVSELRRRVVGTICYRRTRWDATGRRPRHAEAHFDGVAGCRRTPQGGSSRQTLMIVAGTAIRSRQLAPRDVAGLMGLLSSWTWSRLDSVLLNDAVVNVSWPA